MSNQTGFALSPESAWAWTWAHDSTSVSTSVAARYTSGLSPSLPLSDDGTPKLDGPVSALEDPRPRYVGNSISLPNGYRASFVASENSAVSVADSLAAVLNQASSPVTAVVASGGTQNAASVTLTAKSPGAPQNGPIRLSLVSTLVTAAPASLSGGAGVAYDSGTVTANVNGTSFVTSYGQLSSPTEIAASLAAAIYPAGLGVVASAGVDGALTLTASQAGTGGNGIALTLSSSTNEPQLFSSPSFSGGSGVLSGGTAGSSVPTTVYSYNIASPTAGSGYAANGNVLYYDDLINGNWSLTYDTLNRAGTAAASAGPWATLNLAWTYDSFGNRTAQTPSGTPEGSVPQAQTLNFSGSSNHIGGVYQYDNAGNVLYDSINVYAYDAEGRICSVYNPTLQSYTQYIYDAEGRRVGKGAASTSTCNPANITLTNQYVLDQSDEVVSELDGSGNLLRSNVYANGQLLATYANNSTYFALADWLGSKRVVTNPDGTVAETCANLPFGDELTCTGALEPSAHHFTGKERDSESGNDYFGARYYGSSMGRFLSPDPSGLFYANPSNPQSFNLYSYAQNNPLKNTDPTGLDCVYFNNAGNAVESIDHSSNSGECGQNGGDFVNGTTSASQIQYNSNNDTFNIQSSSTFHNYNSTASAPGAQTSGIPCYGNCDTANGYSSSFKLPGFTVQLGLSGNLGVWGPLTGVGFIGLIVDSHGTTGTFRGGGGGLSAGTGASAGLQLGVSNGNGICAYGGPFGNTSATAGAGVGGTLDGFVGYGDGPGGLVSGGSITVGIAGGADASATITGTTVTPFGGTKCQ